MDWTSRIDGYCERTDFSYWSEPVNALTNLAFLLAAVVVWPRARGTGRLLAVVLFVIGIGSWLFHTEATRWASLADTAPILAFILIYVFAACRDFLGLSRSWAVLGTLAFLPYAALTVPLFRLVPGLGSSAAYSPVPVLILGYALLLRRRAPGTARGLAAGAGMLVLSLCFRTLDGPLCAAIPLGTHFLWHLANAVMLGWMILVHARHLDRHRGPKAG